MERSSIIKVANPYRQILYCPKCKSNLTRMGDAYFCQDCAHSYPIVDGIPSFVDRNATTDSFDALGFEFLFQMEQKHFWHIGRKEIILHVLRRNIPNLARCRMLEIGCGNGSVLAHLKQNGVNTEGGDIFLEGLRFCQQRVDSVTLYHIDILGLPFVNSFDIIGIFDVLEHIDDDEKALVEISQALKPGGKLILTVPAYKFLWSYSDVQSHHERRYNKKELTTKLERNGFIIKRISFFMFFLFPVLAGIRLIGNIFDRAKSSENARPSLELRTVPVVNEVFLGSLRLEKLLIRHLSLPFGASLLILAEKTNGE
ncbi:MAG: methyltransferase domain-containing protein [Dehalococcoidia bacterium]|nr:methyltransferase domain-containing protein [Dehalococcoidia bacterium]